MRKFNFISFFNFFCMNLKLDGSSEYVAHVWKQTEHFSYNDRIAVDINKLQSRHTEYPRSLVQFL